MGAFGKMSGIDCRRFLLSSHLLPLLLNFSTPSQFRFLSHKFFFITLARFLRLGFWKCPARVRVKPKLVLILGDLIFKIFTKIILVLSYGSLPPPPRFILVVHNSVKRKIFKKRIAFHHLRDSFYLLVTPHYFVPRD